MCACMRACVRVSVYVRVCVRACARARVCVCMCVCVTFQASVSGTLRPRREGVGNRCLEFGRENVCF